MPTLEVTRAWKDDVYVHSLEPDQRELLPESPVGGIDLSGLEQISVLAITGQDCTCGGCRSYFSKRPCCC